MWDRGLSNQSFWDDQLDGEPGARAVWIPTFTDNQFFDVTRRVYFPEGYHVRAGNPAAGNVVIGEDGTLLGGSSVWAAGHPTAPSGCAQDAENGTLSCATGGAIVNGSVDGAAAANSWYFATAVAPGVSYTTPGDNPTRGNTVAFTEVGDSVTVNGRTVTAGPENAVSLHGVVLNYAVPLD